MRSTTGTLQLRAMSFPEETGWEGGRVVVLLLKEWMDCGELVLKNSHRQAENLWMKIEDGTTKGQLVVGVCSRCLTGC